MVLMDKGGKPVYAECLRCGSRNIRAGRLEDQEYLPVDHYICEECGFRWLPWKSHLWVMKA